VWLTLPILTPYNFLFWEGGEGCLRQGGGEKQRKRYYANKLK